MNLFLRPGNSANLSRSELIFYVPLLFVVNLCSLGIRIAGVPGDPFPPIDRQHINVPVISRTIVRLCRVVDLMDQHRQNHMPWWSSVPPKHQRLMSSIYVESRESFA